MSATVVDASVLVAFYSVNDARQVQAGSRLAQDDHFYAMAHLDAEVVSGLRGIARIDLDTRAAGATALRHLSAMPIFRVAAGPFLQRMWELRANVSPYDAGYVALAELLGAPLVTCDARLTRATGPRCEFELIS